MIQYDIFSICGKSTLNMVKKFDTIEAKNDRH